MLSKEDFEEIRQIVKEVVKDEMTIKDVTVERTNQKTGAKELKNINIYIPEWLAAEFPNLSAALRGVQETADHAKNNSLKTFIGFGRLAEGIEAAINNVKEEIKTIKYDDAKVLKIESNS